MSSSEADIIDKLYKNYDILSDAKEKISEVSCFISLYVGCLVSCTQPIRVIQIKRIHLFVDVANFECLFFNSMKKSIVKLLKR